MKKITVLSCSCHFTQFSVKWQLQHKIEKPLFFSNMEGIQKFMNTPIVCRITRAFISDRSYVWNHDIANSFPKKLEYWCIDFTDCTYYASSSLLYYPFRVPLWSIVTVVSLKFLRTWGFLPQLLLVAWCIIQAKLGHLTLHVAHSTLADFYWWRIAPHS